MADIVERIRCRINDAPMPTEHLLDEAADEIERLRGALNEACQIALGTDLHRQAAERIRELREAP